MTPAAYAVAIAVGLMVALVANWAAREVYIRRLTSSPTTLIIALEYSPSDVTLYSISGDKMPTKGVHEYVAIRIHD